MKKIGIIGGLGPESTIDYYKAIISSFNTKHSDLAYPEIIIYSANLNEFMEYINENQWQKISEWLLEKIFTIHQAGADSLQSPQTHRISFLTKLKQNHPSRC